MFDFEKLEVYKKAKDFNISVYQFLLNKDIDRSTRDQLKRASLSIQLNIAEGTSRFSKADKRNFYVIARGSAYECVAVFDFLISINFINSETYSNFYAQLEELSKMLYAMIRNLEQKTV